MVFCLLQKNPSENSLHRQRVSGRSRIREWSEPSNAKRPPPRPSPSVFGQTGRQITISLSAFILTLNPRRQNYSLSLGPRTDGRMERLSGRPEQMMVRPPRSGLEREGETRGEGWRGEGARGRCTRRIFHPLEKGNGSKWIYNR